MGELKQANFRINTETADAFRAFCRENGMDQAQGFDHIMQIVELDRAKAANPNRLTEIEEFERLAKSMTAAYLTSLELAQTTEERVREQFQTDLRSKDEQIIRLQDEVKTNEGLLGKAETAAKDAEERAAEAEREVTRIRERETTANESVRDKENINAMLQSKLAEAESKLLGYDDLKQSVINLQAELAAANQTIRDNERDAELAQFKAVSEVKEKTRKQIADAERIVAEEKAKAEKEVLTIKAEKEAVIASAELDKVKTLAEQAEKYQKKIDSLQEKLHELQEQISGLKTTKTTRTKKAAKEGV